MKMEGYIECMRGKKYGRLLLHLVFWFFFFIARSYIGFISVNSYPASRHAVYLLSLCNVVSTMAVFYPLVYFVWPHYLAKRKYLSAIGFILILIIIYTLLDYAGEMLLLHDKDWALAVLKTNPAYARYLQQSPLLLVLKRVLTLGIVYQLFVFIAFPLAIKVALAYIQQQVHAAQLAKDNLQMEFNFLKSQVNPHFLFNTLNNIYSLILQDKKQESADTVAKLSDFMRYSLYDAQSEKMPMETEAKLIGDYIALEKLRLNHTTVTYRYETDKAGYTLPSLLFMPLIENMFKYNEDVSGACIHIDFSISNNQVTLHLQNSFDPTATTASQGGIGINNFEKRLRYYYQNKSAYQVSSAGGVYSVHVSIDLS